MPFFKSSNLNKMLPYIFHVAVLVVLFYLLYQFLLAKETFFSANRYLLIASAVLAFLLPLYEIPQEWSIWEAPVQLVTTQNSAAELITEIETSPLTIEKARNTTSLDSKEYTSSPLITDNQKATLWNSFSIWQVLWFIYLIGVGIFGVNLLIQLLTLVYKIIRLPSLKDGTFRIVELDKDEPPYSFLNCIFINPEKYEWDTYNQIIDHEKIHIQQKHSFDMLLAELLVVLQWFNPAAWQYRKMIEHNLEFLTDQAMLILGAKREIYQLNLLKVSVPQYPIGLAMNYNQSILKKRIKMMNAKKSSVRSSWKYLSVLPVLGLSVVCLNAVSINAYGKAEIDTPISENHAESQVEIATENTAQEILLPETKSTVQAKSETKMESKPKIESISIGNDLAEFKGFWHAEVDASEVCVKFSNSDIKRNHSWSTTACFDKNEFTGLNASSGTTKLTREAGEVDFLEVIKGSQGVGNFTFLPNEAFQSKLGKMGVNNMKDREVFHLFVANINTSYLNMLKEKGFDDISKDKLIGLAIHGVTMDYMKKMADIGFKNLSIENLLTGRIHGVTPEYVKEIRSLGYTDLNFQDFVGFRIHGVNREVVESLSDAGFKNLSADKIKATSIHGVNVRYIEEMSSIGFKNLSLDDLIAGKIHGVSPSYIKEIRGLGYTDLEFKDFQNFRIHGVNREVVESLANIGFKDLSANEIQSTSIHGVTVSYIEGIRSAGFDLKDIDDLISFKIHGVSTRFIKEMREMGYTDISASQIKSAAIHGVSTDFVEGFHKLGFKDISLEKAIELKIHGVTPSFIERARAKGMKDLSLNEYKKLKIHGIVR